MHNDSLELLKKLKRVLSAPEDEINMAEASLCLLQFNKNRTLYQYLNRKRDMAKLKYEVEKQVTLECARRGLDVDTLVDDDHATMQAMEERMATIVEKIPEPEKSFGIRTDHDELPEAIRKIYADNQECYLKMRKAHETLKLMENSRPCDRFPIVKVILELDDAIAVNWKLYDDYKATSGGSTGTGATGNNQGDNTAAIDAKRISANRGYLTRNIPKLTKLIAEKNPSTENLRAEMQSRVDELIAIKAGISDEQKTKLINLGINA